MKEGEKPRETLWREMSEEMPFLKAGHIKRVTDLIGVPSYVARKGMEIGGKKIPGTHEGAQLHAHGFLVELKPKRVTELGAEFEHDIEKALQKARGNKPASSTNELSFPVFVPLSEASRLSRERPELIVPHCLSFISALESRLEQKKTAALQRKNAAASERGMV
ncbi:hypothetical protein HY993_02360 [Candidatus Micrarchaeota archaeon]|nr:hypothetical protein [Candidatus Micrarchaeota archaeon]